MKFSEYVFLINEVKTDKNTQERTTETLAVCRTENDAHILLKKYASASQINKRLEIKSVPIVDIGNINTSVKDYVNYINRFDDENATLTQYWDEILDKSLSLSTRIVSCEKMILLISKMNSEHSETLPLVIDNCQSVLTDFINYLSVYVTEDDLLKNDITLSYINCGLRFETVDGHKITIHDAETVREMCHSLKGINDNPLGDIINSLIELKKKSYSIKNNIAVRQAYDMAMLIRKEVISKNILLSSKTIDKNYSVSDMLFVLSPLEIGAIPYDYWKDEVTITEEELETVKKANSFFNEKNEEMQNIILESRVLKNKTVENNDNDNDNPWG